MKAIKWLALAMLIKFFMVGVYIVGVIGMIFEQTIIFALCALVSFFMLLAVVVLEFIFIVQALREY